MSTITTGAYDIPAVSHRQQTALMLAVDHSDPLKVVDGVQSGLALTKLTGMGFNIGAGRAAVNGTTSLEGTFVVTVLSDIASAFDPGDPTYDRIDVIALATDPTLPADQAGTIQIIKGAYNTAGAPVTPTVPAGSLGLYAVTISAGMSAGNGGWNIAKVTDLRHPVGIPKFISFTPTWGGFTNLGTGAVREGRYRIDGNKCTVNVHLKGGVGASMGTGSFLSFSLPIAPAGGWLYYGNGALHHPNTSGVAYDLRIISTDSGALVWATNSNGSMSQPGQKGYPFGNGTDIYCNLEYIVDL